MQLDRVLRLCREFARQTNNISREERGIDRSRNSRNSTALNSRRNFPARNDPLPSSPPKTPSSLSLSLSKLASCLFSVYRPASAPINKASRRMGGETLQAFNFTRNVYVKEKRRGAEPQESDPSFLSFFLLLPIHRATTTANPTQSNPAQVQVVTGVFNKVNFKTPARAEINFNAGYRLSPARSGFLTNVGNGCERDASRPLAGK